MDLCDVSEVGSRSNSLEEQRISLSWQMERAGVFGDGRRVEDVYSSLAAMHHPSCIAAGAFGPYSAASVAIAAYSIVNRVRPEEFAHTIDEDSSVHPTGVDGVDLMSDSVQTNGAVGALPCGSAAASAIPDQEAAAPDQAAESAGGQDTCEAEELDSSIGEAAVACNHGAATAVETRVLVVLGVMILSLSYMMYSAYTTDASEAKWFLCIFSTFLLFGILVQAVTVL